MEPTSLLEQQDAATTVDLVQRRYTHPDHDQFEAVEWSRRDARAGDFFQPAIEAPIDWGDHSIGIVAKLYFATVNGQREDSVRQMIRRVVSKITVEGINQGHFGSRPPFSEDEHAPSIAVYTFVESLPGDDAARVFYDELVYICLHQLAGFNTPTWLNIGVDGRNQCGHACYPLSIQDHMLGEDGIVDWWRKEAIIFKSGGGAGINLSNIRGSMEPLTSGGIASGPLSYMRAANAAAETLKSGGVHRRAAKFVCLDGDHPDIMDFIWCKVREDERMVDLGLAGHDLSIFTPEGERNIAEVTSFQSANNSVCLTDEFMHAVENDEQWSLIARTTGEPVGDPISARDLLRHVAEAAWRCADPGVIFIDTINQWHTTPSLGPITTVNTCGEICQNDDTACNLAALNVLKFLDGEQCETFFVNDFRHVIDVMMTAMDIVNGFSELPTERIQKNTRDMRQCGLGFTNLGAAIMAQGIPYDSDEGRDFAASVTALLTGRAYRHSARMAEALGAFIGFEENRETMLGVINRHRKSLPVYPRGIWGQVRLDWDRAVIGGEEHGYRNSLVTAMMPTGTVSFLLGADTTGIEPAISLVTHKRLAAAGEMTIINQSARLAAHAIGSYSDDNLLAMSDGDFSCVADEDLPVFSTAMGLNSIRPMAHLEMVAAIQPFVSQAISKTTNLPNEATVDDIYDVYMEAWRRGVKVLSVYRDGSKATQVLTSMDKKKIVVTADDSVWDSVDDAAAEASGDDHDGTHEMCGVVAPSRRRLPRTRNSITHKIHVRSSLGEHEGYVTVGMYDDGSLGEMFLEGFGRAGGFTSNALSAWATAFSVSLQYGVPLEVLVRKHVGHSDETGGVVVPSPDEPLVVRSCTSIIDYVARWLMSRFGSTDLQEEFGVMTEAVKERKMPVEEAVSIHVVNRAEDSVVDPQQFFDVWNFEHKTSSNGHGRSVEMGALCSSCGVAMIRTGSCWTCTRCFNTSGCG